MNTADLQKLKGIVSVGRGDQLSSPAKIVVSSLSSFNPRLGIQ